MQRLLVADDSAAIQKAIKLALEPFSVQVFTALSLSAACESARVCRPEVIIADAKLTGVSSPEDFLPLLSCVTGKAPLLLLEGSFEQVNHATYAAVGLVHFLKKPFDLDIFVSWLQAHAPSLRLVQAAAPAPAADLAAAASAAPLLPPSASPLNPLAEQQLSLEVQAFCRRHFHDLAREVIQEELQKLAAAKLSKLPK